MSKLGSLLLFVGIVCLLLAGIHYYLWARLVRDLALPAVWHRGLSFLFVALFASVPIALLFGRFLPPPLSQIWLRPSYTWLGVMWLLLVSVVATEILGAVLLGGQKLLNASFDVTRRETLNQLLGYAAAALGGGATLLALGQGYRFRVKRVEVELAKLPQELDGMTIVQLTDVHIGPTLGRRFMEEVVRTVNELNADVVAITGDLVDGSVEQLEGSVAPLADLQSRHGVYFVTGNHEYYSGVHEWCNHLTALGIRVLRNERVAIGGADACFDLAGIDDHHARSFGEGHGADLDGALAGRDLTRALVLLAHQPRALFEAVRHGVDLQLSGHTHGGQLWPFNWLVRLQQPVVSGLKRIEETLIYVSNGTGYWGPPMRLAAPAEVTQIVLRAAG